MRRIESLLVAFLHRAGCTGGDMQRDWATAVLAEAEALAAGRRRAWLLGGAWFVARQRRPVSAQMISAWVGMLFALMLLYIARSQLIEDAPDMPRSAAVAMLVGAVILVLTFLVISIRPLVGMLVAVAGLPAYAVLVMAARRATLASFVSAPPPPGMAPLAEPVGGVAGFVLALVMLVGVPSLALLGALLPALVQDTAGHSRGDGDAAGRGAGAATS